MKNLRHNYIYILITAIIAGVLFVGCSKKKRVQKALASYNFEKAYEVAAGDSWRLQEVAEAEIKYDIQNGNEEHAFQIAQEHDLLKVYTKNVQNIVTKYIHDKNFDKAIDILSTWQLENSSTFETKHIGLWNLDSEYYDNNCKYNKEVDKYNEYINSLMNSAYQADDQNTIQRGLKLYKPNMVIKSKKLVETSGRDKYYDITWEAKNTAYESAVKRFTKK